MGKMFECRAVWLGVTGKNHACGIADLDGAEVIFDGKGKPCVRGMPNVKEIRPKSVIGKALRSRDAKGEFAAAYP